MDAKSEKFTPMVFTKDDNIGVVSFTECFERWIEKADSDPKINLLDVFGMSWDELKSNHDIMRGPKRSKREYKGMIPTRDGKNNTRHGERFINMDIIKKWDEGAKEKLAKAETDEEKAELKEWLAMTPE